MEGISVARVKYYVVLEYFQNKVCWLMEKKDKKYFFK
jgi:hypothetical protein